jgi:hypothetical protein
MIMCAQACCNPHATGFRICPPFFQTKILAALTDASTGATNARHTWAIVTATTITKLVNHYDWHVQLFFQPRDARLRVANILTARILNACLYASMLCACLTSACHSPPPKENTELIRIEILGFPDCPNTPQFHERVQAAATQVGGFVLLAVDQQTLPTNDVRRGYPAPTALVHASDLFGLPVPTSPTMSCRTYAGGLPRVNETAAKLRAARAP